MNDVPPPQEMARQLELTSMLDGLRQGRKDVRAGDRPVNLLRQLGTGGTKTVYDALIDELPYALALPNTTDGVQRMSQKWEAVMREPENTARIRALNIHANPLCETIPLQVNGVPFTGLKMTRYEDLPFEIIDGKNPASSTATETILPEQLDQERFLALLGGVENDLAVLINNGVRVGKDSINICRVNDRLQVFMTDLGSTQFKPIVSDDIEMYCQGYSQYAVDAIVNGLGEEEYQKNKGFLNGEAFGFNNPNNVPNTLSRSLQQKVQHSP